MSTSQRRDLQMNIPALRKLDAMLIVSTKLNHLWNFWWTRRETSD